MLIKQKNKNKKRTYKRTGTRMRKKKGKKGKLVEQDEHGVT